MKKVIEFDRKSVEDYSSIKTFLNEVEIHSDDLLAFLQLNIICADLTKR